MKAPSPPSSTTTTTTTTNESERRSVIREVREITIITADSSADPLLDEHFRRSLGANYENLFKKDKEEEDVEEEDEPMDTKEKAEDPVRAFKEDGEGYTGKKWDEVKEFINGFFALLRELLFKHFMDS